jgi:hypothetical protein
LGPQIAEALADPTKAESLLWKRDPELREIQLDAKVAQEVLDAEPELSEETLAIVNAKTASDSEAWTDLETYDGKKKKLSR